MFKKPNIVTIIKVRRLEWAGHLLRTSDDRTVKKAERSKLRCSDCTENDMKSMGSRDGGRNQKTSAWTVTLVESSIKL
jgi:hypothetical protein